MLRLQQIAKAVHEPLTNVISHLTLKGSGRWFMRFQGQFYGFPSTKKVMVPHELANLYSQVFYKKEIAAHHSLSEALIPKASSSLDSKVVVLLGHFNHGKTSLLDALINHTHKNQSHFATKSDIIPKGNKTKSLGNQNFVQMTDGKMSNLVQEEKHGITQEIRTRLLYLAPNACPITILDTPGQDIFYRMRNASAVLADLGILLVAMDDGVCPQTQESIGIFESLTIPKVVCLNKVDVLQARGEEVYQQRLQKLIADCQDYVALDKAQYIPISAINGIGIESLVQHLRSVLHPDLNNGDEKKVEKEEDSSQALVMARRKAILEKKRSKSRHTAVTAAADTATATDTTDLSIASPPSLPSSSSNCMVKPVVTGRGIILNISQHSSKRQELLLILTEGMLSIGDYFTAGGWSGKVVNMFSQFPHTPNNSNNNNNKAQEDFHSTSSISATGYAVQLHVDYHANCAAPRPLGHTVNFLSPAASHTKDFTNAMKKQYLAEIVKLCEEEMDYHQMLDEFDSHQLDESEVARFRVQPLFARQAENQNSLYGRTSQEEDSDEQDTDIEDSVGENSETLESTDEDEKHEERRKRAQVLQQHRESEAVEGAERERQIKIVYKANTDMEISTVSDAYEDFVQCEEIFCENNTPSNEPQQETVRSATGRIVYSGIGDVTLHDVSIAKAANGVIVCYNVAVEKHALRECKKYNIPVLQAEKIQDIISFVLYNQNHLS